MDEIKQEKTYKTDKDKIISKIIEDNKPKDKLLSVIITSRPNLIRTYT